MNAQQSTPRGTLKHKFLLFQYGMIVKEEGSCWYRRDRLNHLWIPQQSWLDSYYDAAWDVIEIDYDESRERILARRPIAGFPVSQELMEFESDL